MKGFDMSENVTVNEMMSCLNHLQTQARNDFEKYARNLYISRVKASFSHLLTPVYRGVFVKLADCYLENDSNYIDLEQQIQLYVQHDEDVLYSAISTRILPFDITGVKANSKAMEIIFMAKSGQFSLQDNNFSFWINSNYIDIASLTYLYNSMSRIKKFSIIIEFLDGSIFEKEVQVSYGCDYIQHSNHKFRQNLSDPRLQFRVNVDLKQYFLKKMKTIKLIIPGSYLEEVAQEQLSDLFHTNLIPVINQKQTISQSFIMDGDHEINWLSTKNDSYNKSSIHEVLAVYADNKLLDFSDYKVIYKDGKVGLEFSQISLVLNKVIYADIYVSYQTNDALMNNYQKVSLNWLNQSISSYKMCIRSSFLGMGNDHEKYFTESLMKILKTSLIHLWKLDDWKFLLKFTDTFAFESIEKWFCGVTVGSNNVISLFFKAIPEGYLYWIEYYLSQLEIFINKNTRNTFQIIGVFQ
ncbi:hypothetical protein LA02_1238 [Francisella philomiragia]|uniref:type VI secretion system baseplate subunit TssF/IglH n=1 Tax=Francisella philomiragia TaxID=28110 RepID=UPI0005A58002|nr:type VI secretion system baseplate subunit TssF/IglH [Francisella philomiragia]AJI57445.1 hypothetical protein LA02_1238 [Francisella philomiragia]